MANHQSAKKKIKQDQVKRLKNRYYAKTMRNAVKKLRSMTSKEEAAGELSKVTSIIDILAKKNVIHANKAANLKSSVSMHVNSL
ncbi:MAG: 30S ribosomal protein S20 [Prolixibacteraceae bacterium]|nr:30S ribosomal protein S20 [Prolixibacteraceae bacterium]